jgi:hypothetical protein
MLLKKWLLFDKNDEVIATRIFAGQAATGMP